jgi:hypothetical protein
MRRAPIWEDGIGAPWNGRSRFQVRKRAHLSTPKPDNRLLSKIHVLNPFPVLSRSIFEWGPRDIFIVPSWCKVSHETREDSVLFSFSDRPVQKALGLWREETLA